MSISKEGNKWRCQVYFYDFKGERHKTGNIVMEVPLRLS